MRLGKRMRAARAFRKMKKKVRDYEDEAARDKALCFGAMVICLVAMVIWRWYHESNM